MRKRRLCEVEPPVELPVDTRFRTLDAQLNYHKFERKKIRVEDCQLLQIYKNEQDSEFLCSCWSHYELEKLFSVSCDGIDPLIRLFYCNLDCVKGAINYDTYIFGKFVEFKADDLAQCLGLTTPKNPSSEDPGVEEISALFHNQRDFIIGSKYKLKHLKQKYYLIAKVFLKLLSPLHSTEYNDTKLLNLIYKMSKGAEVDLAKFLWEKIIDGKKGKSLPFGAIVTKFVRGKIKSLEIVEPIDWVNKPVTLQRTASEGLGKHQSGQYKRFERLLAGTQGEDEAETVGENEETFGAEEEKEEEEMEEAAVRAEEEKEEEEMEEAAVREHEETSAAEEEKEEEEKEEAAVRENEEPSGAEKEKEEKHEEPRCNRLFGNGFCSRKVAPNQSHCQLHMPRCQKLLGKRTCRSRALPDEIFCAIHIPTGEASGCTNMEMGKMPEGLHHKSKKKRATRGEMPEGLLRESMKKRATRSAARRDA